MLDKRSKYLRSLIVEQVRISRRGHIASALSITEILRVLYDSFLNFQISDSSWTGRDRFILSKGHGCMALYAILSDKGFFDKIELKTFCNKSSFLGGHPEWGKVPGVEASTGSLGHGLSIGVGLALGFKIKKMANKVVVLVGDGELNEGSIWEALLSASKHKISNLYILIDYNKLQSSGSTAEVLDLEPLRQKLESFGLSVFETDGHDTNYIAEALKKAECEKIKASAIICHTTKGKGFIFAENNLSYHHKNNITDEELLKMEELTI